MDAGSSAKPKSTMLAELEAQAMLRKFDRKRRAKEVLAAPAEPRWLYLVCAVVAPTIAQFAFKGFEAPDMTVGLLIGMFTGLVFAIAQLWAMQRRIAAIEALLELERGEED